MIIAVPVVTVDTMSVRSLCYVGGVVGVEVEMINGVLKDLMESVRPEVNIVNIYPIIVHTFTSITQLGWFCMAFRYLYLCSVKFWYKNFYRNQNQNYD